MSANWCDSRGHQMHKLRVAVFDLDGTVYPGNSFHSLLKFLLLRAALRGRLDLCVRLLFFLGLRALRLVPHATLKERAVSIAVFLSVEERARFVDGIVRQSSDRLLVLKESCVGKRALLLATAAPIFYAGLVANQLGFDQCVATEMDGEVGEAIRERKRDLVLGVCDEFDWSIAEFYTDHEDDLPLALFAEKVFLVAPSPKAEKAFSDAGVAYSVLVSRAEAVSFSTKARK